MDERQLLWNRYSLHIEMYQKYLDAVLKLNLFYYGITGAIVSFYFSNNSNGLTTEFALLLPILVSVLLIIFLISGAISYQIVKQDILFLVNELELSYFVRTDALPFLLWGSVILVTTSLVGLLCLFFSNSV
jgi:hypothetical protein